MVSVERQHFSFLNCQINLDQMNETVLHNVDCPSQIIEKHWLIKKTSSLWVLDFTLKGKKLLESQTYLQHFGFRLSSS